MRNSIAGDQLLALVQRVECIESEKAALAADVRDIYAEARSAGFDTKIMRKVIALRKKDHAERKEEEAIMSLYLEALDMQLDLPLERPFRHITKITVGTDEASSLKRKVAEHLRDAGMEFETDVRI